MNTATDKQITKTEIGTVFIIYTTLNRIKAHRPCHDGWGKLLSGLGKTKSDDEPLPFARIVEINGLDDALWATRAEPQHAREWRLFAVWSARQVQHLMHDKRSLDALDVAERHANGKATDKERAAARAASAAAWAAASDAASAAAWDAAREAAWAAAWAAARDAASDAASAAAWAAARAASDAARAASDAASAAAREAQTKEFLRIVGGVA